MSFGLTAAGFMRKRYNDIVNSKYQRARDLFGNDVNLDDTSPLAVFIKVNAWEESIMWEALEELYNSAYVDSAEGVSLDRVAQFIGIMRQAAVKATGEIEVLGDYDTVVPIGFQVETADGVQFVVTEEGTISGGDVVVPIEAVEGGTDGNVPDSTIVVIVTPLPGIDSVENLAATTGGIDIETDTNLRERYQRSVAQPGSSTAASIEATLLDVDSVIDAICRVNDTMDDPDADDIPAKSIAPVVYGGDDQDIAEAIFDVKAAGIQSAAVPPDPDPLAVEVTITDSRGVDHVIGFARPEEIDIYVDAELSVNDNYPLDGDDQVEAAILLYINELNLGDDVIYTKIIAEIQTVPGIVDITTLGIGIAPAPVGTSNISITDLQAAVPHTVSVVNV